MTRHATFLAATLLDAGAAQAQDCGAAMPAFRAALDANTAEAVAGFIEEHPGCFSAPARAKLAALGGAPAPAEETAAAPSPVEEAPAPEAAPEPAPATAQTRSVQVRVAHSLDDVEEKAEGGEMYVDSSDLELVNDEFVEGDQIVGMRFETLGIPQGARITAATLTVTVDEPGETATELRIHGEAAGDAPRFTTWRGDVSRRAATGASAAWSPEAWLGVGEEKVSPDLAAIVSEIVGRDDWSETSSLVLIVTGQGVRTVEAFDGDPEGAPLLLVEYVAP